MFLSPYLTGIGIDLSEHHIRLARIGLFGRVVSLHETILDEGLVIDERVEQSDKLKKILSNQLRAIGLHGERFRTTALLAESRVFSSSFLMSEKVKDPGAFEYAKTQAQRDIPIPFSQARMDVSQGYKETGGIRTTVYAVEKSIAEAVESTMDIPTLRLVALEANTKALFRLFQRYGKKGAVIRDEKALVAILDVGHSWTTVALYSAAGSNFFSRTIPHSRAKKIRATSGRLSPEVIEMIVSTIEETMIFFQQKQFPLSTFLLGGVEVMDGRLIEKIRKRKLSQIEPQGIADVLQIAGVEKAEDIYRFGAAIGAGLRALQSWRYEYQHNFIRI